MVYGRVYRVRLFRKYTIRLCASIPFVAVVQDENTVVEMLAFRVCGRDICGGISLSCLAKYNVDIVKNNRWMFAVFSCFSVHKNEKGRGQVCVEHNFLFCAYLCLRGRVHRGSVCFL